MHTTEQQRCILSYRTRRRCSALDDAITIDNARQQIAAPIQYHLPKGTQDTALAPHARPRMTPRVHRRTATSTSISLQEPIIGSRWPREFESSTLAHVYAALCLPSPIAPQ